LSSASLARLAEVERHLGLPPGGDKTAEEVVSGYLMTRRGDLT
jgi:hypothetical protein